MKFTVSTIPADQAGCGWYEILPPPADPVVLDKKIKADWVIVGGGFAGLSAARRLSQKSPDATIVVLDAQRIAWGAAGRNSGFFIDLPHNLQSESYVGDDSQDRKQIRRNRFAIDFAKSAIDEYGLQCFASPIGRINAATDQDGLNALKAYSQHLKKLGEPFVQLDQADLKSTTGMDYYSGGIRMPGCLLVQPVGYIRGIADNLADKVSIYENSPVTRIVPGDTCSVITPQGAVEASKIILTVNGHLESFGLFEKQLMHIFLYGSMTRELSRSEIKVLGGDPEWGITPAHPMGSTIRRLKENRIVVRNHITYNPGRTTTDKLVSRSKSRHVASFRARFPMLPEVEMEYCWGGHLCLSRNSVPVFGEVEKNLYVACCQNGLGATYGTFSGAFIADHALGDNHVMVEEMLAFDQPKKLFPEPFMSAGARAHLWWGQRRAGRNL